MTGPHNSPAVLCVTVVVVPAAIIPVLTFANFPSFKAIGVTAKSVAVPVAASAAVESSTIPLVSVDAFTISGMFLLISAQ